MTSASLRRCPRAGRKSPGESSARRARACPIAGGFGAGLVMAMRQDYGHQLDERSLEPLGQLLDLAHGRSGVLAEYRFEVVVEGVHVDTVQPEGDAKTGQNPLDIVAADLALLFRLRCHWDLAAVGAVKVHQVCLPSSLTPHECAVAATMVMPRPLSSSGPAARTYGRTGDPS